jgi:hypothetical protein
MIKVKSFRELYNFEEEFAKQIEDFLNTNSITRENIVSLKYFSESHYIYCMLTWEDINV